ncbi:MAG: redoxin domain-containing protein, partial [Nitrosopumilus sp.]
MKNFPFFLIFFFISTTPLAFAESEFADYSAYDENGNVVKLSDYRGEVLFVNVWATWCVECREEMSYINELHDEFSEKGIRFINISIDTNPPEAIEMAQRMNMKSELWYDPGEQATRTFKMFGPPVTVIIDENGNQIHKWPGAIVEGTDVETRLANAIGLVEDHEIEGLSTSQQINLAIAFSAGLLSFLSPCILPLIPAYTSFITGMSLKELSSKNMTITNSGKTQSKFKIKTTVLSRGSMFVLGFSIVFITLGVTVS